MVSKPTFKRPIILNALFLDKIGKQSGTYFMATSIIRELNEKGLIHLYAGYYHLKTGKVDLLNDLEECYDRNHND